MAPTNFDCERVFPDVGFNFLPIRKLKKMEWNSF